MGEGQKEDQEEGETFEGLFRHLPWEMLHMTLVRVLTITSGGNSKGMIRGLSVWCLCERETRTRDKRTLGHTLLSQDMTDVQVTQDKSS